jgi:hypothetical protein
VLFHEKKAPKRCVQGSNTGRGKPPLSRTRTWGARTRSGHRRREGRYINLFLLPFIDKRVLNSDMDSSFYGEKREAAMKAIQHQALIGAFLAAVVVIGASAAPDRGVIQSDLGFACIQSARAAAIANAGVVLTGARDLLLDAACDAYGEIASRLRQR